MTTAMRLGVGLLGRVAPRPVGSAAAAAWFRPRGRRAAGLPGGAEPFAFDVADRRVTGFTVGSGDPVLLVHGWGGVSTDMSHLATAVADAEFRAISLDLPGHGSDRGSRADLFLLAVAIDAATAEFGDPGVVMAHSAGASAVFTAFAHGGPHDVVLFAPALRMERFMGGFSAGMHLTGDARRHFERRVERFAGPRVLRIMRGQGDVPGARVTIIHDPDDPQTPFEDSVRYAREHPDVTLVEAPGLGHRRILRDPAVIATAVASIPRPA